MFSDGAVTFEDSKVKAKECLTSDKKVARLIARACGKAKRNYEGLLGAWESLHILLRIVRAQISGEYVVPVGTILAAVAAMIYFVEPLDLIPDSVPVFGLLDDVAVISLVMRMNIGAISKFRKWECVREKRNSYAM